MGPRREPRELHALVVVLGYSLSTYFTTASDLVAGLRTATCRATPEPKMRTFTGPSVLVIDELGYLPMEPDLRPLDLPGGVPAVRARLDRADVQPGFSDWGQVFADQVVAVAILDRLLHHATVVNIKGKSYRMRRHRAQLEGGKERGL